MIVIVLNVQLLIMLKEYCLSPQYSIERPSYFL